ncbi:hypothetical protein SCUCBS95973_009318 [Sporothrix curviconia]|uniref:Uncharacterized protein n=1 Tax=Sporothrix curviconia TaxID=1260050 RepID=A0ABP0CVL7_9PEZI
MDEKQASPELLQAEPLPTQEEQEAPASPPSRKRQIDNDDDSDAEPSPKRARLTRKNLALFDKMGKKKTSDPTDDSKSTKTTSTTTSGFALQARKNGILDPRSSKPPKSLEEVLKRHAKTRATASPPESSRKDRKRNNVGY